QIALQYDAVSRVISVKWKIDARNDGSKLDQIEVSDARIVIPPNKWDGRKTLNDFLFDNESSGFQTLDAAEAVPLRPRIFIKENESASYFCILNQHATAEQIGKIAGAASSRRCLQVQFKGTDRQYGPLTGCFDLLPNDAVAIVRGEVFSIRIDD